MNSQDIIKKCTDLSRFWAPRNDKFKEWYSLIEMVDTLAQTNMESFVGNDPQAAYKLILGILDQPVPHRIATKYLSPAVTPIAAQVRDIFDTTWENIFTDYRRRGRYWQRTFISFLLSTGWYSVFSVPLRDGSGFIADVWHPATVYQNWDDELVECAHIADLSPNESKGMRFRAGWEATSPRITTRLYDYWMKDGSKVFNATSLGNKVVKDWTQEVRLKRIPIFTAPAGGLPDTGLLTPAGESDRWKKEIGQASVATNENIYKSWNKWWTFSMQLMRDTAQARIKEKSRSGKAIVKPEDVFRRGAIWRMSPEEDVSFVAPPPIPVEVRASQLDMEAMMQRGGPNWAMYGNLTAQMTAYAMSQVSASVSHSAKPYHRAIIDMYSDIDNSHLDQAREYGYKYSGKELPELLPPEAKIDASYEIHIPGDLIQRATTARMLDPNFEMSPIRVMQEIFPEIENPYEELAQVNAYKGIRHPVRVAIALVDSLEKEAQFLEKLDPPDIEAARLHRLAADKIKSTLEIAGAEELPQRQAPGIRPETIPPEAEGRYRGVGQERGR